MTTQEVDYAGNEYKQKIDRCVLGNEFEDNCDDYWNISWKISQMRTLKKYKKIHQRTKKIETGNKDGV